VPYAKKHFLEMSDREREARRRMDLARPGRDAIEGVYPEAYLAPAVKGFRAALAARQPASAERLYNIPMPKEAAERASKQAQKELIDDATESARKKNTQRIQEQLRRRQAEVRNKDAERLLADVAGRTGYSTLLGQPVQEYKKGGSVKAKASRGDGVAKRGKTRGRFI
jgi:hypothetical protein